MSWLAGPYLAAVVLLAVAGVAKVASPDAARLALRSVGLPDGRATVRALGAIELALAAWALLAGGAPAAIGVAVAYAGFAGFAALVMQRSATAAPCGCFGRSDAPIGRLHVAVDVALAAVSVAASTVPVGSLWDEASGTPAAGVPLVVLVVLLAWLAQVSLTVLPELWAAQASGRSAGAVR